MSVIKRKKLPDAEGVKQTFNITSDGDAVIEQSHDVSGILRANHFQRTEQTMHHESETFNHVARIDLLAIKNWCAQRGINTRWWARFNQENLLKDFLNDPDNEAWRTRKGKI